MEKKNHTIIMISQQYILLRDGLTPPKFFVLNENRNQPPQNSKIQKYLIFIKESPFNSHQILWCDLKHIKYQMFSKYIFYILF